MSRRLPYVLGLALSAPIFIHIGPDGLSLGQSVIFSERTPGVDLPISVFLIGPLLLYLLSFRWATISFSRYDAFVAAFVFVNLTSYLVGLVFYTSASDQLSISFFFFAQTLVPLLSYFAGRVVPRNYWDGGKTADQITFLERTVIAIMATLVVSAFLLVVQTTLTGDTFKYGRMVDHIGPFTITKIKRYYPTLLSISVILLFGYVYFSKPHVNRAIILQIIGLSAMLIVANMWSRAAIMTVIGGLIFLILAQIAFGHGRSKSQGVWLFVLGATFLTVLIPILVATEGSGLARLFTFAGFEGDVRRASALIEAAKVGLLYPLGEMYQPVMNYSLGGAEYDFRRIRVSENAYLDLAIRAGPLAVIAVSSLVLSTTYASLCAYSRATRMKGPDTVGVSWLVPALSVVLMAVFFVSNQFQQNFTEPYAAMFVWYLIGVQVSLLQLNQRLARIMIRKLPNAGYAAQIGG